MIVITDKSKCCGCTACYSICPQKCIELLSDEEGFIYPKVKSSLCVDCKLCEKVCPVLTRPRGIQPKEKAYIVRCQDNEILRNSSSGGFFTALCKFIISKNGVVFGAAFDEQWNVKHCFAETLEQCAAFQGSKYVQSNIKGIFHQVKEFLTAGRWVCFSGTPCQVEGLQNYLNKKYENLILVDFVCHGVPSASLWKEYLCVHNIKNIKKINFRDKCFGYQLSGMSIDYTGNKKYFATARTDIMLKTFFSHIALRWSCYKCNFKGIKRCSDFTVYDAWHVENILGIKDDDKGYTNVIVRGNKAEIIINEIKEQLYFYPVFLQEIIPVHGGMLMHSAEKHKYRDDFYKSMNKIGIKNSVNKFLKIKPTDLIIEKIKIFSSYFGIAPSISRLRKRIRKNYIEGSKK